METVDVYTERGDLVTCSDCGKVMLLPYGADKCPACKKEGCLVWTDESLREADIDSLLERHCNLHQKSELQPEEYLSLSILVTEYIPYLADKPQTARETLFLLLETGSLFEKYWRDTRCFQSENIYTPAIKTLEDFFRVVAGERPAKEEVSFSSDKEGNYYFNGRKVKVENSDEYAYRLLKTKIQTSYRRPVDFYFRFLARFGPYGTYGNVYYPSITDLICRRYLPETAK